MLPFLLRSNGLEIPTYLVINSLVFCLGTIWIYFRASQYRLDQNAALDLCLACMLGSFIGARLFHVVFEEPQFYLTHPDMILKFWYGGFVYYGGLAVGLVATYALSRRRKYPFLKFADIFSLPLAAGYALGRVGCLAAGCCYGRPTTLPWAIYFPGGVEAPAGIGLHPTQLYSSLWELAVLGILISKEPQLKSQPGRLFGLWLILHGLGRGLIEQFRGDFRGPTLLNLSISTWLSGIAIGLGFWLLKKRG